MTQLGTKKSRKGCTQCKRRRVKCDEQSPCANCVRRGEQCSLTVLSPSTSSAVTDRDEALPATADEWLEDMELMHHYSSFLSKQPMAVRSTFLHLWQNTIPNEALKHKFLCHGLLALTALNLAHLRPTESAKYQTLADRHQTVALSGFRTTLTSGITLETSGALFALASVVSMSSMARSCASAAARPPPEFMTTGEIAEVFFLTR